MTANKLRKKDIKKELGIDSTAIPENEFYNKLKVKLFELEKLLYSETMCSIPFNYGEKDETLIKRNVICANNCIECAFEDKYKDAYYELCDILDFKTDDEYLSKNEIGLLYITVKTFRKIINKNAI